VTVIRKTSRGEGRSALLVALGGAVLDTLICALIGFGFGWLLEIVMAGRLVKAALALVLVGFGMKILVFDRNREEPGPDEPVTPPRNQTAIKAFRLSPSFFVGVLQGAANPILFVNWTLLTGFLVAQGFLATGPAPAAGFALGVGLGVFVWFVVLVELVQRLRNHPAGEWIRNSTTVAGLLLVGFGLFFLLRTFLT
jgi:threonine/homoserine/homoserine lactone efflux protein